MPDCADELTNLLQWRFMKVSHWSSMKETHHNNAKNAIRTFIIIFVCIIRIIII
jgi:hypothetical protein